MYKVTISNGSMHNIAAATTKVIKPNDNGIISDLIHYAKESVRVPNGLDNGLYSRTVYRQIKRVKQWFHRQVYF